MVSADANLRTLYRISEEAARATDSLDSLLDRILGLTIEAVGADRACMPITPRMPRSMMTIVTSTSIKVKPCAAEARVRRRGSATKKNMMSIG